jgi:hypothetical protein
LQLSLHGHTFFNQVHHSLSGQVLVDSCELEFLLLVIKIKLNPVARTTSSSPEMTTKDRYVVVSEFHQYFPRGHRPGTPMRSQTLKLRRGQGGKDLFGTRRGQRNWSY